VIGDDVVALLPAAVGYRRIQGLLIGFFGSALHFAVDKYEPDRAVAFMLKLLVVMWGAAAVFHPAGFFGSGFF
jgi:hypothetical protein